MRYYDSMLDDDKPLTQHLLRWVKDEYKNKQEEEVDLTQWEVEFPKVRERKGG